MEKCGEFPTPKVFYMFLSSECRLDNLVDRIELWNDLLVLKDIVLAHGKLGRIVLLIMGEAVI